MTVAVTDLGAGARPGGLPLALSLALREQRNGLRGFYVFIACVALGVAVITGVGALADALRSSFERQGEALLGGDVTCRARTGRPRARSATGCGSRAASARRRPCAPWRGDPTAPSRPWSSSRAWTRPIRWSAACGSPAACRSTIPSAASRAPPSTRSCSSGWGSRSATASRSARSRCRSAPPSPPSPTS